MRIKILASIFFQLSGIISVCQVTNNQIESRVALTLDEGWYTSSTTNSNVEWDCINKALTNKCLIYHNDQWFTIKPPGSGPVYLNVSKQNCRKRYGVQMVIIEGDPCKTDSYRLKKCIPFTDQSDFFVRLDSLDPDQEYLINIDGYLGDLCDFRIAFSSAFQGIPISPQKLDSNSKVTQKDSLVSIEWVIHDSLAHHLRAFEVYRKKDDEKSATKLSLPMVYNAYGLAQKKYTISDTLKEKGQYTYSIYGTTSDDKVLLSREKITYPVRQDQAPVRHLRPYKREIAYFVKDDGRVSVEVRDEASGKKLFSMSKKSTKGKNTITLDFSVLVEQGILKYNVIIKNKDVWEEHTVRFDSKLGK